MKNKFMESHKKLYRSRTNKMIFGLCGGLGEYFNVDPTLIRILFILLAMPGGAGALAYLIISLIVPLELTDGVRSEREEKEASAEAKKKRHRGNFHLIFGAILVAIGFFLLVQQMFPLFHFGMFFWPILLILFGAYLLVREK